MSDAGVAVTLREVRGFIFDADGTLYRGEAVLPGAAEFIADLRRLGVPWLVAPTTRRCRRPAWRLA